MFLDRYLRSPNKSFLMNSMFSSIRTERLLTWTFHTSNTSSLTSSLVHYKKEPYVHQTSSKIALHLNNWICLHKQLHIGNTMCSTNQLSTFTVTSVFPTKLQCVHHSPTSLKISQILTLLYTTKHKNASHLCCSHIIQTTSSSSDESGNISLQPPTG